MVPPDRVEGQRRGIGARLDNLAVRHKPQLDQRLKAVADARHQSVALLQKTVYFFLDCGVAEERRDEFAAAVRLVAAGESAGNEDDLRRFHSFCKSGGTVRNVFCGKVADHHDLRLGAGTFECARRVVFAVRAGEYRDEGFRFCYADLRRNAAFRCKGDLFYRLVVRFNVAGEHGFQLVFVGVAKRLQIDRLNADL